MTFAFDILGDYVVNGPQASRSTYTDSLSRVFPQTSLGTGSFNIVDGSAGVKINLVNTLLLTANLSFKLNEAGLRANVVPLAGLSYSF